MPSLVMSHGSRPEVIGLTVSSAPDGIVHALTDNQGVFAQLGTEFKWVCEDAVYAFARTQGLALRGPTESRWIVATNHGLHISTDGGCDFQAIDHELGTARLSGLWSEAESNTLVTAMELPDDPSRVFQSGDDGVTWTEFDLAAEGRVLTVQWLSPVPLRALVHSERGLYLQSVDGQTFDLIRIRTASQEIPANLVRQIQVSPSAPHRMLAIVESGERSRLLLSDDLGTSWSDAVHFDEAQVSVLFDHTGAYAIALGAEGGRWRSLDAGQTWRESLPGAPTVHCLTRGLGGRVYACSDPNRGGPWVIGQSEDFGVTWTPVLERFEDTVHRKDCQESGRTYLCCRGRCPGDQMNCGQPLNPDWPPECYEGTQPNPEIDAGMSVAPMADAAMEPVMDAGLSPVLVDMGVDAQTEFEGGDGMVPMAASGGGEVSGCATQGGRSSGLLCLFSALLLGLGNRRRSVPKT